MSQKYTCKVKVAETVKQDDELRQKIDLIPLLTEDDMKALLRGQLEADGWTKDDSSDSYSKKEGVISSTLSLETMEVRHKAEVSVVVNTEVSATADTWNLESSKAAAQEAANKKRQDLLEKQKAAAQEKASKALADAQGALTEGLSSILRGVYAEALKQKARKIGDVVSQTEGTNDKGEYELIIKVEL